MTRLKNTLTYIGFAFLMFIVLIHSSNALNSIIFYNPSKYQINFEYQITHTKTGQKYSEGVVELPPGENKKIELRQDIQEKTTVRVVRVCFKEGISLKYLETFWYFNKATMQENDSVTFPYKTQENKEKKIVALFPNKNDLVYERKGTSSTIKAEINLAKYFQKQYITGSFFSSK